MRFVIQRVKHASVTVDGNVLGKIEKGFMVLIGVCETDDNAIADKMVKKLIGLRIFDDESGVMNRSVLDVGGIGYNIKISADTASRLPGIGEPVKLYTYTNVKEDSFQLFGFLSRNDLEIFKKCITVNGIGPKGALAILSVLDADSLRFAIMSGDVKAISKAPGIGAKSAERIILDLKDKIKKDECNYKKYSIG